jgi:C4-dicarboxylate transporter DctM subunit
MIKKGYRADFTVGVVMAGGTLGIMIPPSLPFVTYGIITETSIARLLMAGLIPGLMISAMLCAFIFIRVKINPGLAQGNPIPKELILDDRAEAVIQRDTSRPLSRAMRIQDSTVLRMFLPALLILLVLGSMYMGWATPTECAGIGAIGALVIVYILGRLKRDIFRSSLISAARTSAMVIFLVINGFGLTYIVSYLGIAQSIASAIVDSGANKWVVLLLVYALWLILGCLLDPGSMIVLTIPFLLGALTGLGFDKIWLGVVSTLLVEVGMITPPVGMNLFVCKGITGLSFSTLMKGGMPFLLVFLIALVLLTVFPEIALWLPNRM